MSLALAAILLAAATPAETPRAFVERIYARYREPDFNPLAHPRQIFAAPLVAEFRKDLRLSGDDIGYMDADPLCQCQDAGGLRPRVREVSRLSRSTATARVQLNFGDSEARDLRLRLVRTAAGWRVADIVTDDELSLLEAIGRFNRRRSRP